MKIIAKQTPPEYQESPFEWAGTMWENLAIVGNRSFHAYMPDEFRAIWNRFDESRVLRALKLYTGKTWDRVTIRGTCQSEWQDVYFPVDEYSLEDISVLEIEYFNLGTEWEIIPENAPDDSYFLYCYKDTPDEIRLEISNIESISPDEIRMLEFTGWSRTAEYTEVCPA